MKKALRIVCIIFLLVLIISTICSAVYSFELANLDRIKSNYFKTFFSTDDYKEHYQHFINDCIIIVADILSIVVFAFLIFCLIDFKRIKNKMNKLYQDSHNKKEIAKKEKQAKKIKELKQQLNDLENTD